MNFTLRNDSRFKHPSRRCLLSLFGFCGAVLAAPGMGAAQTPACTPIVTIGASAQSYTCIVPAGSYNQRYVSDLLPPFLPPLPFNFTNNGNITVIETSGTATLPALQQIMRGSNGTPNGSGDAGPAGPTSVLNFVNNGAIAQSFSQTILGAAITVYAASIGGNGGNLTSTSGNHTAGTATPSEAVTMVNNGTIGVTASGVAGSFVPFGAALLLDSLGGQGGSAARFSAEGTDNPFPNGRGRPGADAAYAWLQNYAAVTADWTNVGVLQGYWGVAARAVGGQGGAGNIGAAGGSTAMEGTYLTNAAPVSVGLRWYLPFAGAPAVPYGGGGFAVLAYSQGGDGYGSHTSKNDGGAGGSTGFTEMTTGSTRGTPMLITLNAISNGSFLVPQSAAIGTLAIGGRGGTGYDKSIGGAGGNTTRAWATVLSGVTIQATGDYTLGVLARAQAGDGGNSGSRQDNSAGGDGGSNLLTTLGNPGVQVVVNAASITTNGLGSAGVMATNVGGAGGQGLDYDESAFAVGVTAGRGGAGGQGGSTVVTINGAVIATRGEQSPGIVALSQGGRGGRSGDTTAFEGKSAPGGAGGSGGMVQVTLGANSSITTAGAATGTPASPNIGILASSIGGAGGNAGDIFVDSGGERGNAGHGGSASDVTVTLAAGSMITTGGAGASGILAQSLGGAGGSGLADSSATIASSGGNGGNAGPSGAVTITSAAQITTAGQAAHGIVGRSVSGISGDGGAGAGVVTGRGGNAGASAPTGAVSITNTGSIATSGVSSFGIQAQSIGGGTGSGGSATGGFVTIGGSATVAASGGSAIVSHAGRIATSGDTAPGILVQSIGGGGGSGGDTSGVVAGIGGAGGGGGGGGAASAMLSGTIATVGRLAPGIIAQSIGGGGGHGGDASATGVEVTLTIGGGAGGGGKGGAVNIGGTGGSITTAGSNAIGILAQSVGGGGGAAGGGYSVSAGVAFNGSVAVGGRGGAGGDGGAVAVDLSRVSIATGTATRAGTNTNPVDAHGILAQSIGGGGGVGGSDVSQALTIGIPNPEEDGKTYAVGLSFGLGGSGGTAGNGGAVNLRLGGGSAITTQGQGGHGILLQSVGGGGGAGGDSSAMATMVDYARAQILAESIVQTTQIAMSVGGSGTAGGTGGSVTGTIDGTTVTTFGDYANGILAQSIGGGGGNGGLGSSNTSGMGGPRSVSVTMGIGGTGGSGGNGGPVALTLGTGGVIQTYGASAIGMAAQSIGGGGGASQGNTFSFSGIVPREGVIVPVGTLTLNVGRNGGGGGGGGTVNAQVLGRIATGGGNAAGVVLQSIGGGGGIAGSAGADASADNPIEPVTRVREIVNIGLEAWLERKFDANLSATVTVGGIGGAAGNGGAVTYSQSGQIATRGDWAHGIVAQSIGGGGGIGGVAEARASRLGLAFQAAVGGSGGAGGNGGRIDLNFASGSSIATGATTPERSGYAAFGVLAQSIGGGGGLAADGSAKSRITVHLGGTGGGSGGTAGDGGTVAVTGTTSIVTSGDVAAAMVLQSIGGGGGLAGNGSSVSAGIGPFERGHSITGGARDGASGNGGAINFGTDVNYVNAAIRTSGAHAYGVLAQSIGGGGGFAFAPGTGTFSVGSPSGASGNGSAVSLYLNTPANSSGFGITTSGFGAHGIVAQSIGGGGGIAGLPTASSTNVLTASSSGTGTGSGAGGGVTIITTAPITTTGAFAHGIIAQSISGGGGLYVRNDTEVVAGSTNTNPGAAASAGTVVVGLYAPITASGANATAIFAQAVGGAAGPVKVDIVTGAISGGSGSGWGVYSVSNNSASFTNLASGTSVSAISGNAIFMTAGSVNNFGTVTGNYALGNNGTFTNYGVLNGGSSLVAAQLDNAGTVLIGAHAAFGVSAVSGNFTQRASGRLLLDADFSNRRSDVMTVAGSADLAGRVRPVISSVLPNVELPFLNVNGPVTGSLVGDRTSVFSYNVNRKGGAFTVSANADFMPAGYRLDRNIAAVANHMQTAWDAGGAGLGPLFALLGNTADAGGEGAYRAALRQISPGSSLAPGARLAAGARGFASAAMSCPQFEGTTAMLREGECIWAGLTGRTSAQAGSDGLSSFRLNTSTWQAGGQWSLGGGWFLGGSIAYESARLSTTDGLNSGRGQAGFAAVTAKYQTGPWLLAGALFGGGGELNSTRTVMLPGFGGIARGSPALSHAGAALRATYTMGGEEFYLRPSMTLSLVHARSSAYRESGVGALSLDVSSASSTVGALTPALEVGGRRVLSNGMALRLYTSAGVSLLSEGRWNQESRLVSAAPQAGRFSSTVRTDQVVGRVTAGVQAFLSNRLELRLQYEGEYSANLTGHGGSLTVAYRF